MKKGKYIFMLLFLLMPLAAWAGTTANFDSIPENADPTTYVDGVSWDNSQVKTAAGAYSGTKQCQVPLNIEFHTQPMVFRFSSGQKVVRLQGKILSGTSTAKMLAYDGSGNLLAQTANMSVGSGSWTQFEITRANPDIRRIDFHAASAGKEAIDDLYFEGDEAPPAPTEPPVVTITAPGDGSTSAAYVLTGNALIEGGQLKYSYATFKVESPRPSGAVTNTTMYYYPQVTEIQYNGGPAHEANKSINLYLGLNEFTASATNISNLTGSDSIDVFYLPTHAQQRVSDAGLTGFEYGKSLMGEGYVVYSNGALGVTDSETFLTEGEIWQKWESFVRDGYPRLGAPTSEIITVNGDHLNARYQDFEDGRIFVDDNGSYWVPSDFVDVMNARGGVAGVGIPLSDPLAAMNQIDDTAMFQTYRRPGRDGHEVTLEIRHQRLHIERIGGDMTMYSEIDATTPTIVEVVDRNASNQWDLAPASGTYTMDLDLNECNGMIYDKNDFLYYNAGIGNVNDVTPEWVTVQGRYDQHLRGLVIMSHLAGEDNPFAHETTEANCDLDDFKDYVTESYDTDEDRLFCRSDWDLKLIPDAQYDFLRSWPSDLNQPQDFVQVEFELAFAKPWFVTHNAWPQLGDLVHVVGRHIADCGHAPVKSEIHPPGVMMVSRSGIYNDKRATENHFWVNQWFTGNRTVVHYYAPPRPAPNADLNVTIGGESNNDLNYAQHSYFEHFSAMFTVVDTYDEPTITDQGQSLRSADNRGHMSTVWLTWSDSNRPLDQPIY